VRQASLRGALGFASAAALLCAVPRSAPAKDDEDGDRVSFHFQATVMTQAHPSFGASYSGQNSLRSDPESATSVVADLSARIRLWKGADLLFQPEVAGGRGLSSTLGVAAFPSGEVFRVGDPTPAIILARLVLRQAIDLGDGRSLSITAGKLAVTDLFDSVPVASDPHTGFSSWGLWASAAYDYPADTRGYTVGAAVELSLGSWSARAGVFLEPTTANGSTLEWDVTASRGLVAEVERRFSLSGKDGAVRILGFWNVAPMGSYDQAVSAANPPDVTATRTPGRSKPGFAASANQDLGRGTSIFVRASYNDGANETWAFTEIDRSLALGAVQSGSLWNRDGDQAGAALVASGLSGPHRRYLSAGGYGFLIGDSALSYGAEVLGEMFYRLGLTREISVAATYQPIFNPAFNQDRGPAHVFSGRVHVAF
jgi:high affinity Mn2+ porin